MVAPRLQVVVLGETMTAMADHRRILIIGCSDGIGLASARRLLGEGWQVLGISRSRGPLVHPAYRHEVVDVGQPGYRGTLADLVTRHGPFPACLYCAAVGGGSPGDSDQLEQDLHAFQVNLMAAIETAAELVPPMVRAGHGRFVVLSSQADRMIVPAAASYTASKAAMSAYFEGLALATRPSGVLVTNIRFGFVDTKLATSPVRPFMRSVDWAADVVVRALAGSSIRVTRPRRIAPIVGLLRWLADWRIRLT
jgi:NAD(P)-dependent dehydrogenase (short-subunit alcohol dehydrogenase family)